MGKQTNGEERGNYPDMIGTEPILYLQSNRSPLLDLIMLSISALGSRYAYMVMLPTIYWVIDRQRGWILVLVFLLSMQMNAIIKEYSKTPRPYQADEKVFLIGTAPHTYAFPSGHAQGSTMIWGGLCLINPSVASCAAYGALIFLIGLSRLYLGVHWPVDVAFGWILGVLGLAVMSVLFKRRRMPPGSLHIWPIRLVWVFAGLAMICLSPSKDTVLAGGTLAAAATLEYWERKWIGFEGCGHLFQRVMRLICGFIPAGAALGLFQSLAFESLWARGIFFFLMGGWMVLGAPYVFNKMKICVQPEHSL